MRALLGVLLVAAVGAAVWFHTRPSIDAKDFQHGEGWHGSVYRPAGDSPQPLLIVMDPGGDEDAALSRYKLAADTHRWTIASTRDIYNGTPTEQDSRVLESLADAVAQLHPIDESRLYLAGFSGTGVQAYYTALTEPDRYTGAIAECAHTGGLRFMERPPRSGKVYVFTRYEDFNSLPSKNLAELLEEAGVTAVFVQRQGGHNPMDQREAAEAVGWFEE